MRKKRQVEGYRPDGASRWSLDGPHAVQIVLIRRRVTWRQDASRGLVLDRPTTLSWTW